MSFELIYMYEIFFRNLRAIEIVHINNRLCNQSCKKITSALFFVFIRKILRI